MLEYYVSAADCSGRVGVRYVRSLGELGPALVPVPRLWFLYILLHIQIEIVQPPPPQSIQTEKMDKAPVEAMAAIDKIQTEETTRKALEAGEALVVTGKDAVVVAIDKNQTERCAESDLPAGVDGIQELSDEFVAFMLSMPKETPLDPEDIVPFTTTKHDLAKLLNRSEEWVEEQRRCFEEDADCDQRIYDDFEPFQNWTIEDFFENGWVEVDEEYLKQVAELEEYGRGLWDDLVKKHGGFAGFKFAEAL